jgi:hypothetical protein
MLRQKDPHHPCGQAEIRGGFMQAKTGYARRSVMALAVMFLGALVTIPSSVAQSGGDADRAAPTETFLALSTKQNDPNLVLVGFGPIHAKGIDRAVTAHKDVFRFPHGSLIVRHQRVAGNRTHDPVTCLFRYFERGTYQVVRGTGDYVGAHGHGHYIVHSKAVACRHQPPDAAYFQIQAHGPLQL